MILVGDPKQLPAVVRSPDAKEAKYDRSLFERLMEVRQDTPHLHFELVHCCILS